MITKTQFCQHIIDSFCCNNNLKQKHLTEDFITQSSSLAVAMEFLGLLETPEFKEYAANRAGIFISVSNPDTNKIDMLTVREILELLPEAINDSIKQ